MEENENREDLIYDLEGSEESEESEGSEKSEESEESEGSEKSEKSEGSEGSGRSEGSEKSEGSEGSGRSEGSEKSEESERSEGSENADNSDNVGSSDNAADPAMVEIGRMVEEMGAETLLEIIRDNRNAAIRQIISEVEASRRQDIPSGSSATTGCSSIFDLAALA